MTHLGAWGARSPFPPDSQEIGPDSIVLALRSLFDAEAASDLKVEIAVGELDLNRGAAANPDVSLTIPDAPTLAAVLTGQLPLDEALSSGAIQIKGGKQTAKRFLRLFPMPEPCECTPSPAPPEAVASGSHGT